MKNNNEVKRKYKAREVTPCSCGWPSSDAKHLNGVFHEFVKEIKTDLDNTNLSLGGIGKKYGVSRQRIHQIAKVLGYDPSSRRDTRRAQREQKTTTQRTLSHRSHHAQFLADANTLKLQATPIDRNTVNVNGHRCAIRVFNARSIASGQYCQLRAISEERLQDIDYVLQDIGDGWLVIPAKEYPINGTSISILPKRDVDKRTQGMRHDYMDFKNAWSNLYKSKANK